MVFNVFSQLQTSMRPASMRILSNFNRGVTQRRNPRSPFVRRNCLSSLSTQTRSSFSSGSHSPTLVSPLSKYNAMVEAGDIVQDQRQLAILSRFETLFDQLHDINNANTGKKGLYLYGGVGIGKTMLMDLFYTCLAPEKQKFATRKHFHQFMLDVHQRIHVWKQEHPKRGDPLPSVGRMIGEDSSLICFDEVAITDVADALILRRLFEATLDTGAVLVATSNRPPEDLYKGGINRHVFLPFIDLLHEHCHVIDLDRMAAELLDYDVTDYRQLTRPVEGVFNHPGSVEKEQEKGQGQLSQPQVLTQGERTERMRANMNHWYTAAVRGGNNDSGDGIKTHAGTKTSEKASLQGGLLEYDTHTVPLSLPVLMNRTLEVRRASPCGRVGVFSFDELCDQALGSADYTALCRQFKMVLLEDIPRLTSANHNQARRFIILLDALYENNIALICSAECGIEDLFEKLIVQVADDNDRDEHYGDDGDKGKVADASSDVSDYSRGDSPFSHYHVVSAPARTGVRHSGEGKADSQESNTSDSARSSEEGGFGEKGDEELDMHVTGDGGSSGRSTTMINNMEWSATGRIGVSLAELSSVEDVGFAFRRAKSRLKEMRGTSFLNNTKHVVNPW